MIISASCQLNFTTESFAFEDENEYEIKLNVFARVLKKKTPRKALFYFFSPKKLVRLFILKEVKPSPDSKMINFLNLITGSRH